VVSCAKAPMNKEKNKMVIATRMVFTFRQDKERERDFIFLFRSNEGLNAEKANSPFRVGTLAHQTGGEGVNLEKVNSPFRVGTLAHQTRGEGVNLEKANSPFSVGTLASQTRGGLHPQKVNSLLSVRYELIQFRKHNRSAYRSKSSAGIRNQVHTASGTAGIV